MGVESSLGGSAGRRQEKAKSRGLAWQTPHGCPAASFKSCWPGPFWLEKQAIYPGFIGG